MNTKYPYSYKTFCEPHDLRELKAVEEEVFITCDSYTGMLRLWDIEIGIIMKKGCIEFRSASMLKSRTDNARYHGQFGCTYRHYCMGLFGFVPKRGAAYLYNFTTRKATRIDQDLCLWSADGRRVVSR